MKAWGMQVAGVHAVEEEVVASRIIAVVIWHLVCERVEVGAGWVEQ